MAQKSIKSRINGVLYTIDPIGYNALCESPDAPKPSILLANGLQNQQKSLILLIHELLHACNWSATEDKVHNAATDIGKVLWRLGWRLKTR